MNLIYLVSSEQANSTDIFENLFFRVSVTIEPRHSLQTVGYDELFDSWKINLL